MLELFKLAAQPGARAASGALCRCRTVTEGIKNKQTKKKRVQKSLLSVCAFHFTAHLLLYTLSGQNL